jgi:ribosome-binding protein aMBF1 (putative translation factor)
MTRDALEILDREFGKDDPDWERGVAEEELRIRVGQIVYRIRQDSGLTQAQLAKLVGTHRTNISKIEHADYEGSALEMLARVCLAVHKPLDITYRGAGVALATG